MSLIKEAFENCFVINNKINFFKQFSFSEIMEIYSVFSKDLLDYNIPHNRVVGILYPINSAQDSVLRMHEGYGMSILKLGDKVSNIIPLEIDGNDISKGCYVNEKEKKPEICTGKSKSYTILKCDTKDVGQLLFISNNLSNNSSSIIGTESLRYYSYNIADNANNKPRYLIKDVEITNYNSQATTFNSTILFYMRGTGVMDFDDTARLFTYKSDVFPCRTRFDLSTFITCKFPSNNVLDGIELFYRSNIDESVLTEVLRNYARGVE